MVCLVDGDSERSEQEDKEVLTGKSATQIRQTTIRDDISLDKV